MIHSAIVQVKPVLNQPVSLGHPHIIPASLVVIFYYSQLNQVGGIWKGVVQEQILTAGTHFTGNVAQGTITLLPHSFWQQLDRWRAADTVEPLLYKNQVKAPQYVEASFEYYAQAQVTITADKASIAGDGTEPLTLTVSAEDGSSPVPIAVYNGDGAKFATIPVSGSKVVKASLPGVYRFETDRDVLDPTWNLPLYAPALVNGSVTVEVTSA